MNERDEQIEKILRLNTGEKMTARDFSGLSNISSAFESTAASKSPPASTQSRFKKAPKATDEETWSPQHSDGQNSRQSSADQGSRDVDKEMPVKKKRKRSRGYLNQRKKQKQQDDLEAGEDVGPNSGDQEVSENPPGFEDHDGQAEKKEKRLQYPLDPADSDGAAEFSEAPVEREPVSLSRSMNDVIQQSTLGPTITVYVGLSPPHKYTIHEGLACYHSDFFRGAFRGKFAEARMKKINLPEDNPRIFELFVVWIYYGKMSRGNVDLHFMKQEFSDICALYILADKLQAICLKNAAINALYARQLRTETIPDISDVIMTWNSTVDNCTLRLIVVELFALRARVEHFNPDHISLLPPEFVSDVLQRALYARHKGGRRRNDWNELKTCDYHDHPDGQRCEENVDRRNVPKEDKPTEEEEFPVEDDTAKEVGHEMS